MKRIVRLTESDLTRIVRRVINEQGGVDWDTYVQTSQNNKKGNMLRSIAYNPYSDGVGFSVQTWTVNSGWMDKGSTNYYYCNTKEWEVDSEIMKGLNLNNPNWKNVVINECKQGKVG